MMTYTIIGIPIPLQRPRFSPRTGHIWDCQKPEKLVMYNIIKQQHGDRPIYDCAFHIDIEFVFTAPKSYSNVKRSLIMNGHHMHKPDLDNLLKFPLDVMNGLVYVDDGQIVSVNAVKKYGPVPMTLITFTNL